MNELLWYLTRAAGLVGLVLLSATVVLGLLSAGRAPEGGRAAFVRTALHRSLSLVMVVGVAVHVLTAVAETYVDIGWLSVLLPFSSTYDRFWVGLGTLAFDLLLVVVGTSLLRHRISARRWRLVHWASYAMWPVALAHGLGAGTSDGGLRWATALGCAAAVLGTAVWRSGRQTLDAPSPPQRGRPGLAVSGMGTASWGRGVGRSLDLLNPPARLSRPLRVDAGVLLDRLAATDLRGRGGGAFPTAAKIAAAARAPRRPVLLVNACDGEPLVAKDEVLLRRSAGLVADGAALVAALVGATEVGLAVHAGSPAERHAQRIVVGEPLGAPARLLTVPRRYVASEASALASALAGGEARPFFHPTPLTSAGYRGGAPVLVLNAETVAQVALVHAGRTAPLSRLVTLSGDVAAGGVLEVDASSTPASLLASVGGPSGTPAALLVGGYGGSWLGWDEAAEESLAALDARVGLGAGLLYVHPAEQCPHAVVAGIADLMAAESGRPVRTVHVRPARAGRRLARAGRPADRHRRVVAAGASAARGGGSRRLPAPRRRRPPAGLGAAGVRAAPGRAPRGSLPGRADLGGAAGAGPYRRRPDGGGPVSPVSPVSPAAGAGGAQLQLDPTACTATGLCAGWLPERVSLDEWGYPVLAAGPLPEPLVRHARRAARECPVRALRLRER